MTPTKYTKERAVAASEYPKAVKMHLEPEGWARYNQGFEHGSDFARTYTLKEMEPIIEKLRSIDNGFKHSPEWTARTAREALELWDAENKPLIYAESAGFGEEMADK